MKPTDLRNHGFERIQGALCGLRAAVYAAWQRHGPCTTQELAARSGLALLSLRPRTSELCELGLVELVGDERGASGIYRARPLEEVEHDFVSRRAWNAEQMQLI
jgi:DNA-binding IscR family transcriptional regulator